MKGKPQLSDGAHFKVVSIGIPPAASVARCPATVGGSSRGAGVLAGTLPRLDAVCGGSRASRMNPDAGKTQERIRNISVHRLSAFLSDFHAAKRPAPESNSTGASRPCHFLHRANVCEPDPTESIQMRLPSIRPVTSWPSQSIAVEVLPSVGNTTCAVMFAGIVTFRRK